MKGILITTDGKVSVEEYDDPLYKTVGEAVGGYIEVVHPRGLRRPYLMIVNEDGLNLGLPVNTIGSLLYGTQEHGHPIVGNAVVMKEGKRLGEPDIVGITLDDNVLVDLLTLRARARMEGLLP